MGIGQIEVIKINVKDKLKRRFENFKKELKNHKPLTNGELEELERVRIVKNKQLPLL